VAGCGGTGFLGERDIGRDYPGLLSRFDEWVGLFSTIDVMTAQVAPRE